MRPEIKENLQQLFNQLEAEYQTSASLSFKRTQSCHFNTLTNNINIGNEGLPLEQMRWILAHEFGHAVDLKQNKDSVKPVFNKLKKRFFIFMAVNVILLLISKLLPVWFFVLPLLMLLFLIKIVMTPEAIDQKRNSEIFSDKFANEHVGGGAPLFKTDRFSLMMEKIGYLIMPRVHPFNIDRQKEALKYPAKDQVFFPENSPFKAHVEG